MENVPGYCSMCNTDLHPEIDVIVIIIVVVAGFCCVCCCSWWDLMWWDGTTNAKNILPVSGRRGRHHFHCPHRHHQHRRACTIWFLRATCYVHSHCDCISFLMSFLFHIIQFTRIACASHLCLLMLTFFRLICVFALLFSWSFNNSPNQWQFHSFYCHQSFIEIFFFFIWMKQINLLWFFTKDSLENVRSLIASVKRRSDFGSGKCILCIFNISISIHSIFSKWLLSKSEMIWLDGYLIEGMYNIFFFKS